MAKYNGHSGLLYCKVDRIQSVEGRPVITRRRHSKSPAVCHMNGKSSKDIYLESKAAAGTNKRELANAFRL